MWSFPIAKVSKYLIERGTFMNEDKDHSKLDKIPVDDKTIIPYIKEFDFSSYMIIKKEDLHLTEEKYSEFSEEFWTNPSENLRLLKNKYKIDRSIPYPYILLQYPTDKYISLLRDSWDRSYSIIDISDKYSIPVERILKLQIHLPYKTEERICPICFKDDKFIIENDIKNSKYNVICRECNNMINHFLTIDAANEKKKIIEDFELYIKGIETKLKNIACPKCLSDMTIYHDKNTQYFEILCTKCDVVYTDYTQLLIDDKERKKRAAMMISIKELEAKKILDNLDNKKEIVVEAEEQITHDESIKSIEYIFNKDYSSDTEGFNDLFKSIKLCNRMEKKLLVAICELIIENPSNNKIPWYQNANKEIKKEITFYMLSPDQPIIQLLEDKTGIIVIRKIIRKLIDKNLVYCCEKLNQIHVHPSLLTNLSTINNLLKPQSINTEIAHLIFHRQKYTCLQCGETGRPLKIAYLNKNKNPDIISSQIGVCDIQRMGY